MLSLLLLILIWAPCLSFKLIFALETMHRKLSLWSIIFIWAPGLIFNLFFTIILQHFYGPSIADWTSSDQRSWHLHHQGEPAYISSDVLGIEKPHWILWLVVLITVVTICFSHSRFPQQAKEGLFYSIVANMLFIRCLSTFPGITHYEESMLWFWFPWDTRSPLKGLILTSFVKLRLWDRLWLGAYSDSSHDTTPTNLTSDDAPSISSHDATLPCSHQVSPTTICIGCAPYVKPSSSHEVVPPLCFGCGFRNLVYLCDVLNLGSFYHGITNHYKPVAWRDAMIRLAFYYVLDSIVVVLQLRFSYPYGEGAPYTSYVNNSEIATWVLILQVSIWKSFRMQERFLALLQKEKVKEKVMTEEC